MTRSRDVADTQDNSGGPVSPLAAGKNAVINGGFDIWQRGTSFTTANNGSTFGPDRWNIYRDPGTGGTVSRQTSGLTNFLYSCRVQRDSGTTGTAAIYIWQNFESQMTYPLAGKTIVFSYYARAGANFSPSGSVIQAQMLTGTGTDQNVFSGYTGAAVVLDTSQAITTTWTRYSHVITLNSNVTEICPRFYMAPSGTAGANDWFEVTGIQIEIGSVPTTFTRAGGTLAGELAACQRYFVAFNNGAASGFQVAFGQQSSTTSSEHQIALPVTMRATPSASFSAIGDWTVNNFINQITLTGSSVLSGRSGPETITVSNTWSGGMGSTGGLVAMLGNKTAARYYLSAEL